MDPSDNDYDPDSDVYRFLDFTVPESLPYQPPTHPPPPSPVIQLPPPPPPSPPPPPPAVAAAAAQSDDHDAVDLEQLPEELLIPNTAPILEPPPLLPTPRWPSGPSDDVGPMIEGIQSVSVEEEDHGSSSSSMSPNTETAEETVFQRLEPGQLDCSQCHILREVLHSNELRNMTFAVHGGLGTFDHALLEVDYLGEGGQYARKELFYVDLSSQTHENVKSIVIECTTLLKADASGVFHDSISSFYDALCGDIPLSAPANTAATTPIAPLPLQSAEPLPVPPLPIEPISLAQPPEPEFTGDLPSWVFELDADPSNIAGPSLPATAPESTAGPSQILPQTAAPQMGRAPSNIRRSWLAIQRQRTANMGLSELAEYLHLPMAEAARRLRLCSTALKHVCRRIGLSRWPSRQINAIDRQIARLQRDLVRGTRRGGLLAIKEELDRLEERRARLYEGNNPREGAEREQP